MMYCGVFCSVQESLAVYVDWKSGLALGVAFCELNAYIVSGNVDGAAAKTDENLDSLGQ